MKIDYKQYRLVRSSYGQTFSMSANNALNSIRQQPDKMGGRYYGGMTYHYTKGAWSDDRKEFYCDDGSEFFRNVRDAKPTRGGRRDRYGWYCDDMQMNVCVPMIGYVTGKGWIAGIAFTDCDGETWWPTEFFDDEDGAVRSAEHEAEQHAQKEMEYGEGYRDGHTARDDFHEKMRLAISSLSSAKMHRDEAREKIVHALSARSGEEGGFLPPGWTVLMAAQYQESVRQMRYSLEMAAEHRKEAIVILRNAPRKATYEDWPYAAGYHEAF